MKNQEIELIVSIFFFGVVLFVVNKLNKGKKKGDPRNYYMGEGQLLDTNSVSGNVNGILLGVMTCFLGWYLDEIGRWIWHVFGSELIVSVEKERWHRIVSIGMGLSLIASAFLQLLFVLRVRRNENKENEIERLRQFHNSHKE